MTTPTTAVGHVPSLDAAQSIIDTLLDESIPPRSIEVLARVDHGVEEVQLAYRNGALPGIAGGATLGAIAATLGSALAAGPVGAATAVALGSGAVFGATTGGLTGLGLWDWTLEELEADPSSVLVAVRNPEFVERAVETLRSQGATRVRTLTESPDVFVHGGPGRLAEG